MTVRELIKALRKQDPSAEVKGIYDGASRMDVDEVWMSRSGAVVLAQKDEPVYYDEDRAHGAPSDKEDPYWSDRKIAIK